MRRICGRRAFRFWFSAVVVVSAVPPARPEGLSYDRGVVGLRRALAELQTAASLLHTTAHPDDEHGGVLARLARGEGVRVALLSLTRGEAGANAIGPELFDGLGWIRAEELSLAGRYYGLDALYFTRLADYGYSKRLEEAIEKWGREEALRDMVFILRTERPLVVVSRFRGDERDGHGQHQFAGAMTREAFRDAADPSRFPEQIASGLRPWRALKLYVGGAREDESWSVAVDSGVGSPWLGDTFENVARTGLSLQRSQTSGQVRRVDGSFVRYYDRIESHVPSPPRETGFFDGIDTSLSGVSELLGAPAALRSALESIQGLAGVALDRFDPDAPERIAPALARGLDETRRLRGESAAHPDLERILVQKERQFAGALALALGLELEARAMPLGASEGARSPFTPAAVMGPAVPGQELEVEVSMTWSGRGSALQLGGLRFEMPEGTRVEGETGGAALAPGESMQRLLRVKLPAEATPWTPNVVRDSIAESRYRANGDWWRRAPLPAAVAEVDVEVEGVVFAIRATVTRWESQAPYGDVARELTLLPSASVRVSPELVVVRAGTSKPWRVDVTVRSEAARALTDATVALELPSGFEASPETGVVTLGEAGETAIRSFLVRPPPEGVAAGARIGATLRSGERVYREGYLPIAHRDLETRYRVVAAEARVVPVDVDLPGGLRVGYVMGVGDEVPEAIAALGADVKLLGGEELEAGGFEGLDAIVVGTRAYAVREDLRVHNGRLLDYVKRGGNLIVLYNTFELDPNRFAPFPGELLPSAEEISEEDAPVRLLAPEHRVFTWPNRITASDFDGWVEQRGSKFWSTWDDAYTPMVVSGDTGQSPQRGGWLSCRYGEGSYTYFAYALHRQLPYGVAGAYRILANLLSLGRRP